MEPASEAFATIGTEFVRVLCTEYTCDSGPDAWNGRPFFTADLYNELAPPSSDLDYLSNVSFAVHAAIQAGYNQALNSSRMHAEDPTEDAEEKSVTWITQGWMFHSDSSFWQKPQIQAFLDGVPNREHDLMVLDLYAEVCELKVSLRGIVWSKMHFLSRGAVKGVANMEFI